MRVFVFNLLPYGLIWVPVTASKETIAWAAKYDHPITPGAGHRGAREDITRYYARCLEEHRRPRIYPAQAAVTDVSRTCT